MLSIKRIYDLTDKTDGFRVLIDRLWPRGLTKERANLDLWFKDIAPSSELRSWFQHDPEKFVEFTKLYTSELEHNPATEELLKFTEQHVDVTLLYGAKDPQVNHAVVLMKFLNDKLDNKK